MDCYASDFYLSYNIIMRGQSIVLERVRSCHVLRNIFVQVITITKSPLITSCAAVVYNSYHCFRVLLPYNVQ